MSQEWFFHSYVQPNLTEGPNIFTDVVILRVVT
jgi:hypothetical protein